MSYSAFFTSGLRLASLPHTSEYDAFAKNAQLLQSCGIPSLRHGHGRARRRRPSLTVTVATSPIRSTTAARNGTNDAAIRTAALRSPRETGSSGVIPVQQQIFISPRPAKAPRRKTISSDTARPSLPAPTQPLPRLPSHYQAESATVVPGVSADDVEVHSYYPSSPPITADSSQSWGPAIHTGTLRANPARKSSFLLPPGRGSLLPSSHAGSVPVTPDEAARRDAENACAEQELLDDYFDMKENDGDD